MINRKIFAWGLYDFGNSLWVANGTLYISQWLIIDNQIPDIFYGLVFSLSSILLVFTTPFFGLWSDTIGKRMPFLWVLSILTTSLGVAITLFGVFAPTVFWKVSLVLLLFFLMNYFYQLSLVFYNALLPQLVGQARLGRVSGIGEFFGNLGWIVGAMMTLPIIWGKVNFFGGNGRIETILPTSILFMLLALPMLFSVKDNLPRLGQFKISPWLMVTQTFKGFRQLRRFPGMTRFLIAFYFYSNALLTLGLFFPIYFQQVLDLSDSLKVVVLVTILVGTIAGSVIFGFIGDRIGHKRGLILAILGACGLLAILLTFNKVTLLVYLLALILGIFYGGIWVLSRSLLVILAPSKRAGEFFGYLAMSSRVASVIGPLLWGGVVAVFGFLGVAKYRVAFAAMIGLLIIGAYILRKVPNKRASQ